MSRGIDGSIPAGVIGENGAAPVGPPPNGVPEFSWVTMMIVIIGGIIGLSIIRKH